jgi:hypothetical protein
LGHASKGAETALEAADVEQRVTAAQRGEARVAEGASEATGGAHLREVGVEAVA